MGVDTSGERHGTGVPHNLLDHGLVYMGLCQHGDAGVPGTVWRLVISKLLHQGCEVTIVVVVDAMRKLEGCNLTPNQIESVATLFASFQENREGEPIK